MYKVLGNKESGWSVVYQEEGKPDCLIPKAALRPTDEAHKWEPYKQRSAAYRRCLALNKALKQIDEMIVRDGAIIL